MEAVGNDSYRRTPLLLEILEYLHNDQIFVGNLTPVGLNFLSTRQRSCEGI